ncbi:MAG TPA: MarR family transcriptional regulator [Lachnospiraceae bacterium]|nr:MarR family transcriptional regulator [Lachnospiraceae bacterium]
MILEWKRYYTLWRECNLMYEEWSKEQGLSMNGYLILYSFYDEKDELTQKSISQKWMIPKQTVNTILKDYMQRGFIEAVSMPEDKRNKILKLTKSGKEYANEIIGKLQEKELFVMQKLGMENVTKMNDIMERFIVLFRKGENINE